MGKEKKSFTGDLSPALAFITIPEEPAQETPAEWTTPTATPQKAPDGYRFNPELIEKKSRRVQLILQPSVVEAAKKRAATEGTSVNELMSQALKAYLNLNEENNQ